MNKTQAKRIAEEYCGKYPDMPNLTIAKLLKKEHGMLFQSVEKARDYVRYIRGQKGDKMRQRSSTKSLFVAKSPYFTLPK